MHDEVKEVEEVEAEMVEEGTALKKNKEQRREKREERKEKRSEKK